MTLTRYIGKTVIGTVAWNTRASRKEFWYFNTFLLFVGMIWAYLLGTDWMLENKTAITIIITPTCLSLWIRRLHDNGTTGWLALLGFLPGLVGMLVLLVIGLLPSEPTSWNKYGQNPKEAEEEEIRSRNNQTIG